MNTAVLATIAFLNIFSAAPAGETGLPVETLSLEGAIEGENITFTLTADIEVHERDVDLPLVVGDVAYLEGDFPRKSELRRDGNVYVLRLPARGREQVSFTFASRATKDGDWRRTRFEIPAAEIRKLAVLCDRNDLEIQFPGALRVERDTTDAGDLKVSAFLGLAGAFEVRWKPEVKKLDAELVVSCDANTIATASVGALRLDTVMTYRVIQGRLNTLVLGLPDVNVTQVRGANIQDWMIDRSTPDAPKLVVTLGRPAEGIYRLAVESELVLPDFPCAFTLPVFAPQDVIRSSGFLMMGTDSAIKLQIDKAAGVTQVDQEAFPAVAFQNDESRARPTRSVYAYQYASTPYVIDIKADDIVTAYSADSRIVVSYAENELVLTDAIQLDIKDAPARDITLTMPHDPTWTVTSISGQHVAEADTDVRTEGGQRHLYIPFKQAVSGTTLINVRMEKSLPKDATSYTVPSLKVQDARTERGYLVVAAETGIKLEVKSQANLREVHTGSAPMRVVGAQHAFRFKAGGWALAMAIDRAASAIHAEGFHLVSLGEGVAYCSAAITYHIGGAPVQEFALHIPTAIQSIDITGGGIEGWTRQDDVCTVRLQDRVMGDYTLLVTYDRPYTADQAVIPVGEIYTLDHDSEVGYAAVASSLSLKLHDQAATDSGVIRIDQEEIPPAYATPIADPIIGAYKLLRAPHSLAVRIEPFGACQLLGQIADYVRLKTRLSKDGEAVTRATYFIKNASRQHLVVRLPKDAELWTIKQIDDSGTRDVLSQESDEGILIPVSRPRDPNTPIQIELTYAEVVRQPGFWRTAFFPAVFEAPSLDGTHATFASWTLDVPEPFIVGGSGGNMVRGATQHSRQVEFSRTVNLAESTPLVLKLWIVPAWIGPHSSARLMCLGILLGMVTVGIGFTRRHRATWIAAGLTLTAVGLYHAATGRSVLVVAAMLLVAFLVLHFMIRHGFRWIWKLTRGVAVYLIWHPLRWIVVNVFWRPLHALFAELGRRNQAEHERRRHARLERIPDEPPPFDPDDAELVDADPIAAASASEAEDVSCRESPSSPETGCTRLPALLCLAALSGWVLAASAGNVPVAQHAVLTAPVAPLLNELTVSATGPAMTPDAEPSATIVKTFRFEAKEPGEFLAIPPQGVLIKQDLGSDHLDIRADAHGYHVVIRRRGTYESSLTYMLPVASQDGVRSLTLTLPANMRNRCSLRIPAADLDVRSRSAVLFKTTQTDGATQAEAVFGPTREATLTWQPRVRQAKREKAMFFSEVNTAATLQAGVVDLLSHIRYQVAQGEIREMRVFIPEGMTVTAVSAPSLATWSYDPETHLLEAILERPTDKDFMLTVVTQIPSEGLPYNAAIAVPRVLDTRRQRGALAVAAPDTIQVRAGETRGVAAMNVEDFSRGTFTAAVQQLRRKATVTIRRAYRYHQADAAHVEVATEQVLPEIRVTQTGSLSIGDERTVLATTLDLAVARSGIFSIALSLPPDYEVETLTGQDVSHWDESPAATDQGKRVMVHFSRRVTDRSTLNLVVARTERGVAGQLAVPAIRVADTRKHSGKMTVSAERGVRLMVQQHTGVDILKAADEGIRQAGVLVFEILRPTWELMLGTEVMAPVVKPEVLQWVDLTEGMLQCRVFLRYQIENAGLKTFRLKAPVPDATITVTGRHIAHVHQVDKTNGVWEVTLHNKVENQFAMTASYQVPYNPDDREVRIQPLTTVGTDESRGYVVVTCAGRVQVKPIGSPAGLRREDPRNVPTAFGAGDLSSAILCYHSVRGAYTLPLSVVRHESADVLPASIDQVRMTSLLSPGGRILTRVQLKATVGNLRFLKFSLPHEEDDLWTVQVNGRDVQASRDDALLCIPLESSENGGTDIEFIYAGRQSNSGLSRRQLYETPRFEGLPLNDIAWDVYGIPGLTYHGFAGSVEYQEQPGRGSLHFDAASYLDWNKRERETKLLKARKVLDEGERFAQQGNQKAARQKFEQALTYSQAEAGLNEDARVQWRNLMKQQVKMGLVNRRDDLRYQRNVIDEQQLDNMKLYNDGNYSQEFVQEIEGNLSQADNTALDVVADKIIEQQAAAAGVVTAIRVTMPEHGQRFRFTRAMQIDPSERLNISFQAGTGRIMRWSKLAGAALILFGILRWVFRPRRRRNATAC